LFEMFAIALGMSSCRKNHCCNIMLQFL